MLTLPKRMPLFLIAILILAAVSIFTGWWFIHGKYIQSTDDAYIGGDITSVASKVSGYISGIDVTDNQRVKKGDIILRLDSRDYLAVFNQRLAQKQKAEAQLASLRADIDLQRSVIGSAQNGVKAAQFEAQKSQLDSQRYTQLANSSAISRQIKDNARLDYKKMLARARKTQSDLQTEKQRLQVLSAQARTAKASVDEAIAALEEARLNLAYTVVRAPIDGVIGNRQARVGSWVAGGARLVSLVPFSGLWVDANFKENQIAGMRPGMRAEIHADALKGSVIYGRIASLAPATGASFSLLPVENATGNFTKIVQRVPVRITLDTDRASRDILRPGLSVTVSVNEKRR